MERLLGEGLCGSMCMVIIGDVERFKNVFFEV